MAEGRRKEAWDHTAELAAWLCEVNRDHRRRSRPFTAAEFHPFRQVERKKSRQQVKEQINTLKALTVDPKLKK